MHARKIAQMADSPRYPRRCSGVLTYRRTRRKTRAPKALRDSKMPRHRPLFLVFLFAVSQYLFFTSPLFKVREVQFSGQQSLTQAEMEAALGLPVGSGLFEVSEEVLVERLLQLHKVQDAQVQFEFPGRVQVRVTERRPRYSVAYIHTPNSWFAVDDEGVVLAEKTPSPGGWRILLPRKVRNGTQLTPTERRFVDELRDKIPSELRDRLVVLKLGSRDEVAMKIRFKDRPLWVRLGRLEKLEYKLFLLGQLLQQLVSESAVLEAIDLRHSSPVVKVKTPPRKAAAEEASAEGAEVLPETSSAELSQLSADSEAEQVEPEPYLQTDVGGEEQESQGPEDGSWVQSENPLEHGGQSEPHEEAVDSL